MNVLRGAGSWLSLYLVAGLFFLTANTFALFSVINPGNVKQTVKEEGTYNKIVPAVLSSATYSSDILPAQQLPLNEPWVKEAAVKAFPASDLEQKGNGLIDGTFGWLEGKTEKPEYKLDFTSNKQNLATEIGNSTESRISGLPRCSLNNLPKTIDAFHIDCLPYGISPKTIAGRASSQISNDQGFLKNPIISSDNLPGSQGSQSNNPFGLLEGLKPLYEHIGLLVWLLPIATAGLAALGVFLARDRLKALKRLGRSFISSGVGLAVFAVFISFGFERAVKTVSRDAVTRDIAGPIFISLAHQFRTVYLIFAGIAFVLAAVLLVVRRRLLKEPRRAFRPRT